MRALILVDIQKDFLPGGPLGVAEGDQVIPVANHLQQSFDLVVATQDWHPADHGSFAASHPGREPGEVIDLDGLSQILWPTHCVQSSEGATFADDLDLSHVEKVFTKGTDPRIDSYSGFYDNGHRKATGMAAYLKEKGVSDVYIVGLAADVCVKFTALDAVKEGFATHVVLDGTRGVDLQPGDTEQAFKDMQAAGVDLINSKDLVSA
jgi:nicotinamidase/pyrazinamidase